MTAKDILQRLKLSQNKTLEVATIKRELKQLPFSNRREIISNLRWEKTRSDNSDNNDLIDDILVSFSDD